MTKRKNTPGFKGHRFPPEIIEYAVWLYFRFSLSLRDVEDLLSERGIIASHETIRFWVVKFGRQYAKSIRRDRPPVGDKWHLDEVVITIRGKKHWLWRAVDQNGNALEILVQSRRNTKAAKRAVGTNGAPDRIAIDKSGANLVGLQSLNVILKFTGAGQIIGIVQSKYLNNIVEQDHRFIKRITRPMLGFKAFHSAAAT